MDGPATGAGDTAGSATGDVLLGGVPGVSGARWWDSAVGERGGVKEFRNPLGVDADDRRVWCARAMRMGIGGAAGGSGRRVGIRMRMLREGLGDDVWLDVAREGVGECERPDGLRDDPGEGAIPGGDDVATSSSCCSAPSLFCPGSVRNAWSNRGAPAEPKLGDGCCVSSVPDSPVGASLSTMRISSVGRVGGIAALLLLLALLLFFLPRGHVGLRVRNFTLGPSGLTSRAGRRNDCGLNLVIAFRLVFSRMVSISCYMGIHQPTMRSLVETNKKTR